MKKSTILAMGGLLAVLAVAVVVWSLWSPVVDETGELGEGKGQIEGKGRSAVNRSLRGRTVRKDRKSRLPKERHELRRRSEVAASAVVSGTDESDEEILNADQKKVLADLQKALDDNNLREVRKVLSRLESPKMKTGAGGQVPVCMRERAVQALGWFGRNAAIDLVGYLGDSDDGVRQDALSQFELSLDDSEMSDFDRSDLILATMKAINDPDVIDQLLSQLNNMRNSVKAATAKGILENGSETAKATMLENLEFYLDDGVKDASGVEKWTAEHPDEEGDAELYGGEKADKDSQSKTGTAAQTVK